MSDVLTGMRKGRTTEAETDPEMDPETDPEMDPEMDLVMHPETDHHRE